MTSLCVSGAREVAFSCPVRHWPIFAGTRESISGQRYVTQFREEFAIARDDAGLWRLQTFLHWFVCWGIIASYTVMAQWRKKQGTA